VVAEKQPVKIATPHHHYNPDWLSDDAIVGNYVARMNEYKFLRDELARAPLAGSVQHYLLVGVRGAGKTTLLKRLAAAIRRDAGLVDHLIALSFPEELYQVKNLADFWWAACEALADELDRLNKSGQADQLHAEITRAKKNAANAAPLSDAGFKCLMQTCTELKRRPVLLVDNLDMVFQRIDKTGRKLKEPQAPAYWALREALSTTTSPIVIGGSVRLSEPFTDYDKAFYDFFIPKRLGKLSIEEVRLVLDHLADAQL
jgi:energy-coupling factor transporter ATP-binding protein EcfA2